MCVALAKHGVDYTIVWRIRANLEGQLATATLGGFSKSVAVSRGRPQGGDMSHLLWCLVVDELIAGLNRGRVYTRGYVDNVCLLVMGKFPNLVSGLTMGPLLLHPWYGGLAVRWLVPSSAKKKLSRVPRLACLGITGVMSTTPTHAAEALICLPPLEFCSKVCWTRAGFGSL